MRLSVLLFVRSTNFNIRFLGYFLTDWAEIFFEGIEILGKKFGADPTTGRLPFGPPPVALPKRLKMP